MLPAPPEDCFVSFDAMSLCVWGFVYESTKGDIHIIINSKLSAELQEKVYLHELYHIRNDFKRNRIIGIDMQHQEIERRAEPSLFFGQS